MKTRDITLISLFTVLTVVCSQIAIPLPFTTVPLSLGLLPVFMSGRVLGSRNGALSQLIFILLGCAGLPVFSGFNGGLGAITGPTGGYLVGYVAVAAISGVARVMRLRFISAFAFMTAGLCVCYLLGTLWFVWLNGVSFGSAFFMCVAPFIPLDLVKAAVAALVGLRVNTFLPLKISKRKSNRS